MHELPHLHPTRRRTPRRVAHAVLLGSVAVGWAKGKRLPKGTYRLLLIATDAAGNRTASPAFIDFRIK